MRLLTIGADPEFFIRARDTGVPFPVCGLLGGTKSEPIIRNGYGLQEDNVMCEYNIPPATDCTRFSRHIIQGRAAVLDQLNERFPGKYEADMSPARVFPHELLATPQARTFGCSPDFDGHAMGAPNTRIEPDALIAGAQGAWRFAGGHVHIGYKEAQKFDVPAYVAATFADIFLSLRMLTLAVDKQGTRRQFYGTPGRYRPTPYGIEYRTLGNGWTMTADRAENVGHYALLLGMFLSKRETVIRKVWAEIPWADVKRAITTEDEALAATLISYCNSLGMEV